MKKLIVVGASSAMAEHCMRQWVQAGPLELYLAGRDQTRLERVAHDLKVRQPGAVIHLHAFDFQDLKALDAFVTAAFETGPVSIALVAHGYLGEQAVCQENLESCRHVLEVNGVSPVLFAEAIAKQMEITGWGHLVVIGSVAGDRGRKSNYVYGAAKGLVERYVEGLQHRFARKKVKVTLIKPGPTATPMTTMLQSKGMTLAAVHQVSQKIVEAVDRGERVVYVPKKWAVIMGVVKRLPTFLFHRLDI